MRPTFPARLRLTTGVLHIGLATTIALSIDGSLTAADGTQPADKSLPSQVAMSNQSPS